MSHKLSFFGVRKTNNLGGGNLGSRKAAPKAARWLSAVILLGAVCLCAGPARAATYYWDNLTGEASARRAAPGHRQEIREYPAGTQTQPEP